MKGEKKRREEIIRQRSAPLYLKRRAEAFFFPTLTFLFINCCFSPPLSLDLMARFFAWTFLLLILVSIAACEFSLEGQQHLTENKKKEKYGPGSLKTYQCPNACGRRCSKTQYHKPCMFFCQKCCRKCLCVPPGFYGNKQVCACYNNWKTKRGGPKCP